MAKSYCSCTVAGAQVYMGPDPSRPGYYVCQGCGATEEVVMETAIAMQEQWTKEGLGAGNLPALLQPHAIDGDPLNITPYEEPAIEFWKGSGRSLKEIEQIQKEMTNG